MTNAMSRQALALVPLAAAVVMAGCLQKDTTHTLYLALDGAVAWVAMEKDVRSDEKDPAARRTEEETYLASASEGTHGVGKGLAALDPVGRRTRVLRRQRPFTVRTEAQFAGIDQVFERMLFELRVPGSVTMTRAEGTTTLVVRMDVAAAMADETERTTPMTELAEDVSAYHIVLTGGRFVAASGFTLSDGDTRAVPAELSEADIAAKGGVVELSLTWQGSH
jgi:hypothetical protein